MRGSRLFYRLIESDHLVTTVKPTGGQLGQKRTAAFDRPPAGLAVFSTSSERQTKINNLDF